MTRVVLVVPRSGPKAEGARLVAALDQIAAAGGDLVAIIDPVDHRQALRMVLDGEADVVVTTRPEYFPVVQFAGGLDERTRPVLRPLSGDTDVSPRADARRRRPRPVSAAEVVSAIADTGLPSFRERRTAAIRRTA